MELARGGTVDGSAVRLIDGHTHDGGFRPIHAMQGDEATAGIGHGDADGRLRLLRLCDDAGDEPLRPRSGDDRFIAQDVLRMRGRGEKETEGGEVSEFGFHGSVD